MSNIATGHVYELALAAAPAPLSIDTLVGWNLARPAELWAFLAAAQADGRIAQAGPGQFAFADAARRDEALARATPAEWSAFLVTPERIAWAVDAGRAAAAARRFAAAGEILRALVAVRARDLFPGGEGGWLSIVLETLRLFRAMEGIATEDLLAAIEVAASRGDVGAQGVLHGAVAAASLRDGLVEEARRHLAFARDAAGACEGRVRAEIQMYLSVGLIFQGRLKAGVESFEELLGDVPADIAMFVEPTSPTPARSLLVLAGAYCGIGQVPRALDLLHRLRAYGREHGVAMLEHEADLFACLSHLSRGDHEAARPFAERAYAFYSGTSTDPIHLWFASTSLASILAADGRYGEVPAVLARGIEARRGSRWPGFANMTVPALLEQLDVAGVAIDGFSIETELERMSRLPSLFWQGLAHRYLGRRLARSPRDDADLRAVRDHLETAIALLREAGAEYELSRALADAAGLASGGGRASDAARLGMELREVAARSPARGAEGGAGRSARLTRALVELGRLGSLAARREGTWGDIAARLCRALAAERCALVERADPPRLLAVRGGTPPWRDELLALLAARSPAEVESLAAPATPGDAAPGQLLVVPFSAEGRGGWACLENRYGAAAAGPDDRELLEVVSAQLGILLGNVALSQELASARERLEAENRYWRSTRPATAPGSRIVGDSPALRAVLDLVSRVAPAMTPVLVTGETGVGKELVASEIHRRSPRSQGPFIPVHVASLSTGLVASALFGHERGAFTGATEQSKGRFELADGGTLFLDEVGELSPEDQVRLLRVLQEGTFERVGGARAIRSDFRLVAATNRDLPSEVRAGRFREDLYFRLAAFPLRVPPLRERREEIPTLALFFMERASRARGVRFEGIGEADVQRMLDYAWPGNVRELEHVIERAVLLSEPPRLRIPALDAATRGGVPAAPPPSGDGRAREWITLAEAERRYIAEVLREVRGRVTGSGGAAELLGLKPSTLNFRIRKLGLADELRRARERPA
jgi:transcriptional regulator with GAF, ATPase, and Fis domain